MGLPMPKQSALSGAITAKKVGRETAIMVDANQSLALPEAIRRGRVFQAMGCLWFEEPLPADAIDEYAELAAVLDLPIATGENLYGARSFADLIARRGVDGVLGDLRRSGGPTPCLR